MSFKKKAAVEIDKEGFYYRTSIIPKSKVYWNEIQSIEDTTMKFFFINMDALKITLKTGESPRLLSAGLMNTTPEKLSKELKDSFEKTTANSGFTQ